MSLPWFRMYARFITDPVVEELSMVDQRHFVFVLCLKCDGLLDKAFPDPAMRERAIARRLGLQGEAFTGTKERLVMSGLIDEHWQPRKWEDLQFKSDADSTAAARQRRHRDKTRHGPVTRDVTRDVTDGSRKSHAARFRTDTEQNRKNARARERAPEGAARAPVIPKGEAKAVLQRILDGKPGERKPN